MPFGAPSHTVPKSGCRFRRPHDAISVEEWGSTDAALPSAFHGLSAGKGRRPLRDSPPAVGWLALAGLVESDPHAATSETTKALAILRNVRISKTMPFAGRLLRVGRHTAAVSTNVTGVARNSRSATVAARIRPRSAGVTVV